MVFGDGDGEIFLDFTIPVDVIGHELTHGVTQYTAEPDLLRPVRARSTSRCPTSSARSSSSTRSARRAAEADWLIGAGLLAPGVTGVALRSMKAPGTAYDDDVLGKDPQPATMDDYVAHRPRQRRRPHQLRHPQPRLLPGRHGPRRPRLGEGRADLVRRPDRRRAADGGRLHRLRRAHGDGGARAASARARSSRPCRRPGSRWGCGSSEFRTEHRDPCVFR